MKPISHLSSMVAEPIRVPWRSLVLAIAVLASMAHCVKAQDAYDTLRTKWYTMLTGGTSYDPNDPDISALIATITANANTNWSAMNTSANRTYLWSDLSGLGTVSSQITASYTRLEAMALASQTYGSSLFGNAQLISDIKSALDWLNTNYYNTSGGEYDNWWDWEIGTPIQLNNCMVLLYFNLSSTQISNYAAAINYRTPAPKGTGANLLWTCTVVAIRGVIVKDGTKISSASSGVSGVFPYSTGQDDGFHIDGSYLQHTAHFAYNGGYGLTILQYMAPFIELLQGSSWAITDPAEGNIFEWIYDGYAPLIYKGGLMSMVRGRDISRSLHQDHNQGHAAMAYLLAWTDIAPAADALNYKRMIKYWMQQDTYSAFLPTIGDITTLIKAKTLANDSTVPMDEPAYNMPYPQMDRVVHLRPGFGFALSMFSTRIGNYESINGENLHGWYTGSGQTYLFNADLGAYDNNFWPTVNPYRLPGTTVSTQTQADSAYQWSHSTDSWVGSASLLGLYGCAGMQLQQLGSTLTANKSWFMFDNSIVALASNITSTDGYTVESIIENRQINSSGTNTLTVDGTPELTSLPSSATFTNVNWIHLAGTAASGADIGYYFPTPSTVDALREARTSSWSTIKTSESTNPVTCNYVTLWFDHGVNPTNASYAYVLLPNMTPSQVAAYATNPEVEVLENDNLIHAVKDTKLDVVGANFWGDSTQTLNIDGSAYLSVYKKACVMTQVHSGLLAAAVSDPTQLNSARIDLEIHRVAVGTVYASPGVSVTQLSPTITFNVTPNGDAYTVGLAKSATFLLAPPVISINFQGGGATNGTPALMSSSESAGTIPSLNWNNASGAAGSLTSLIQGDGENSGASATWTAYGTQSTIITDAAGNNRMMKGYLDTSDTSTTTVVVSNLPAVDTTNGYDVYVNCDGFNGTVTRTGNYTIGSTMISATDGANTNFAGTFVPGNNGTGNYVVFSNLTSSSFTLSAIGGSSTDSHPRAPVNGIQIVPHTFATASYGGAWTNTAMAAQTDLFTATFDATPSAASDNATVGLSLGAQTAYTGLACIARFNPSGYIDARNGGAYSADTAIPFTANSTYHFRMVVDIPMHQYSVYVTSPGGAEQIVGSGYAFRTEQNTVASLDNWNVYVGGAGSLTVRNFATTATPSIGVNFHGGGSTNGTPALMGSADEAGILSDANWNNASGGSGNATGLLQSDGTSSTAAVAWSAHATWSTPVTDAAGNNRMMKGYLDTSDTSTTTVTVSNLPSTYTATGYDVYVYCDGDNATVSRIGNYTIGTTTITATDSPNTDFTGTFTLGNNATGNFIVFSNLTSSSFTLSAKGGSSTDTHPRAPVNAIEIVPR
ncbi:MAG TPA: polysaccharide lyase 8 family protein [Lacipirellulaceae bacterium]|nr:polysaccharide lyase 8 family protein [Lacipirellulaceae bacterium]